MRRALVRNLILLLIVALLIALGVWYMRAGSVPVVQVATVGAPVGVGSGSSAGATSVTANGYVVARTKASVSAKAAGRLAFLDVSEGSFVKKGVVIARLDNADFEAAISQAEATVAANEAGLIEAASDRDQLVRDAKRHAATARKRVADAGLRLALANNDNTIIRAPFTGTVPR